MPVWRNANTITISFLYWPGVCTVAAIRIGGIGSELSALSLGKRRLDCREG